MMNEELSGKLIADKYRVGELIREGEAGDLYHGRHEIMDRPVMLKVLPQALAIDVRWQKRFIDEAKAGATVSHPNILQLNDFGIDHKQFCYAVFEQVEGPTLADLEKGADLEERRAVNIAKGVASAVSAAHEKGVIHGELSPTNIFLSDDTPKVYGFGSDPLTVSRDADPRCLAPEQLSKFPAADVRSDVYSVGVILYQMLTGAFPFEGDTAADILARQKNEPPAPFSAFRSDINPEIEPIVLSAMSLDPERRYQSMKAFEEDLELLGTRIADPAAATASAGSSRPVWQTAVVVALGVILLGGALIFATRSRQTDITAALKPDEGSLPVQPIGPATGAQEDALAKLPVEMTPDEIAAAQNAAISAALGAPPAAGYTAGPLAGSTAPTGADTYNPWANGGAPPPGAPAYVPPAGARVSGDPNPNSPFTGEGGGAQIIRKNVLTGECTDFNTGTPVNCPGANDPNARLMAPPKGAANANTANPKPTPKATPAAANKNANTAVPTKQPSKTPTKPGGDQPE